MPGSVASGSAPTNGSLREGMLNKAPFVDFARNMFMLGLRSFVTIVEEGQLEKVQAMRENVNYINQSERLGGLDISELATILEAIFIVIDTWVETTSKGAKAIIQLEVANHKDGVLAHLHKVGNQQNEQDDIVSFIEELTEIEVEFTELKRNKVQLERLRGEARATDLQYDTESQTLGESYQEYANYIESIISLDLKDAEPETVAEAYMAYKCEGLRTKLSELSIEIR